MTSLATVATVNVLRAGLGSAELTFPDLVAQPLVSRPIEGHSPAVIRILGARQLLQALVTGSRPATRALAVGAAVDAIHAASMVVLAAVSRPWRRAALVEAAVATALAAAGAAEAFRMSDRTFRATPAATAV